MKLLRTLTISYKSINSSHHHSHVENFAMQSLIRREGYLIVVDDGVQAATEGEGARQAVNRNDRILAVAPNYDHAAL